MYIWYVIISLQCRLTILLLVTLHYGLFLSRPHGDGIVSRWKTSNTALRTSFKPSPTRASNLHALATMFHGFVYVFICSFIVSFSIYFIYLFDYVFTDWMINLFFMPYLICFMYDLLFMIYDVFFIEYVLFMMHYVLCIICHLLCECFHPQSVFLYICAWIGEC